MPTILNILLESEVLVVSLLGMVFVCYYKTLKSCLVSRCTKVNIGCISCEREPVSDSTCVELSNIEEKCNI